MKLSKMDTQGAQSTMRSSTCPMKQSAEFLDIRDQYTSKDDLICRYKLTDYNPQEGDRVSLYQFGWNFVKDYVLFEWAPLVPDAENQYAVTFKRRDLPKNLADMYQLCYIGVNNDLQGASAPFSIQNDDVDSICTTSSSSLLFNSDQNLSSNDKNKDQIIGKLRDENRMLKECLRAFVEQKKKKTDKNCDDLNQLRLITEKLYATLKLQQSEIELLKAKVRGEGLDSTKDFELGELKTMPPFPL